MAYVNGQLGGANPGGLPGSPPYAVPLLYPPEAETSALKVTPEELIQASLPVHDILSYSQPLSIIAGIHISLLL